MWSRVPYYYVFIKVIPSQLVHSYDLPLEEAAEQE